MTNFIQVCAFLFLATILTSCEVIGDIFGAGVYTGIFIVVFVVGIIIFLISRMGKKG